MIELPACGVSAAAALASATGLAAKACGIADRTGRLGAGLDADLLIVGGDPAADMSALRDVRVVRVAWSGDGRTLSDTQLTARRIHDLGKRRVWPLVPDCS